MDKAPDTDRLLGALQPLKALDASACIQLPPRRIPLDGEHECLIQWLAGRDDNHWTLAVTRRAASLEANAAASASLTASVDLASGQIAIEWDKADAAFVQWAEANLAAITSQTIASQPGEYQAVMERAGLDGRKGTRLTEFIPHFVILAALAVFAYMFSIVHIK
ncbi:MAG: hypothetical protein ACKVGZ_02265 [Alphaproteobacteria bacterium]|jgi:hypothetical protein